jgi:hypothetical protein
MGRIINVLLFSGLIMMFDEIYVFFIFVTDTFLTECINKQYRYNIDFSVLGINIYDYLLWIGANFTHLLEPALNYRQITLVI